MLFNFFILFRKKEIRQVLWYWPLSGQCLTRCRSSKRCRRGFLASAPTGHDRDSATSGQLSSQPKSFFARTSQPFQGELQQNLNLTRLRKRKIIFAIKPGHFSISQLFLLSECIQYLKRKTTASDKQASLTHNY